MTERLEDSLSANDKSPAFPGDGAADPDRRAWLAWAFTHARGWRVGEVIRYGAGDRTPMTVEIVPPGRGGPNGCASRKNATPPSTRRCGLR